MIERVTEEVSAVPTTKRDFNERSEEGNDARCHLPLCSFSLSWRFTSFSEETPLELLLHLGKSMGP